MELSPDELVGLACRVPLQTALCSWICTLVTWGWDEESSQCKGLFELSLLGRITSLVSQRNGGVTPQCPTLAFVWDMHLLCQKKELLTLPTYLSNLLFNFDNIILCSVPSAGLFHILKDFVKNMCVGLWQL